MSELPAGGAGLVVAGIFAAAQSTLASSMNSIATAYVTDFHRWLRTPAPVLSPQRQHLCSHSPDILTKAICFDLATLLLPLAAPLFAAKAARPEKPNVLMIIADDLNDWIGCLNGHPDVTTPNLDRLAQRGLLFTNAHCVAPLCNPSRVATFTGQRPSKTGVYVNSVVWHEVLPGVATIPQHFKANGYYVAGSTPASMAGEPHREHSWHPAAGRS